VLYKKLLIFIILTGIFIPNYAVAQVTKTGTTAAKFLSIGEGPRALAMGGPIVHLLMMPQRFIGIPPGLPIQISSRQCLLTQPYLLV